MYTYKQAYDKIIDAYFRDEIKPFEPKFCFCGTLCNNSSKWFFGNENDGEDHTYPGLTRFSDNGYYGIELFTMEESLLKTINAYLNTDQETIYASEYFDVEGEEHDLSDHDNYEDALFEGMSAALEVLKQIHIERGEVIDEPFDFKKRQLVK